MVRAVFQILNALFIAMAAVMLWTAFGGELPHV